MTQNVGAFFLGRGKVDCNECDEGYFYDQYNHQCLKCDIEDCLECRIEYGGNPYCYQCMNGEEFDDVTGTCGTTKIMIMMALLTMTILI